MAAEIRVIAHALVIFHLAVREYEDGIYQFWIVFDGTQALLTVGCPGGGVAGTAAGCVLFDGVDEGVIVD